MSTEAEREEAVESFLCSLADLTVNSKPHINFLTMVAEENSSQSEAIAKAVSEHLKKVPSIVKLPILYLIDSIMKNVGKDYISLFTAILVDCFASIYAEADKTNRHLMKKLRQTWNIIVPPKDLSTLDVHVHSLDSDWPLTAESLDALKNTQVKILLNPSFLPQQSSTKTSEPNTVQIDKESTEVDEAEVLREQLLLQKRMRDLEKEQKQVDIQLSTMQDKIILVNKIKKCKSDALPYNKAKEKILDSPTILDVEKSENQADSTTVEKMPSHLSDSNTIVPITTSAVEEISASDKRLSGDLLQFLTDLIAKQNLKLNKQEEANHQKYQEHRSQYKDTEYDRMSSRNFSRYPESRSRRSSCHRYRCRPPDGHHRYSSQRDDRSKCKYGYKNVEHSDSESVCVSRVKDHRHQSPHRPSSRRDKKLDSKQCDRHEFKNISVKPLECTHASSSSEPGHTPAMSIFCLESLKNDEHCHVTSPKRKRNLSDLDGASPRKTPCVNSNIIPVKPLVLENSRNCSPTNFRQPLLPTPNVKPSTASLESFVHISTVQSHGAHSATNTIGLCHHTEEFTYTHHTREFPHAFRPNNKSKSSPIERQQLLEIDYNHGYEPSEKNPLVKYSNVHLESRGKQPAFPSMPSIPPIENNLVTGSIGRQNELRQDFHSGGCEEHLAREEVDNSWRSTRVNQDFTTDSSLISLPSASHYILEKIRQDTVEAILVDNSSRKVRFYGEVALINVGGNNLREISFKPAEATIIVNGTTVPCAFHYPDKEIASCGRIFKVRLGAPTRELYVNGEWFQCSFNCPPKNIQLSTGEVLAVQLHSNATPLVHIGAERHDLVAGHITLRIDSVQTVQIFLDAKPQRFDVDGVPHILKFADALQTILINDYPVNINFGGPPILINVNDARHFVQLSELPSGVIPGEVNIISMTCMKKNPHTVCPVPVGANVSWELAASSHSFQKRNQSTRKARGKRRKNFKAKDSTALTTLGDRGGFLGFDSVAILDSSFNRRDQTTLQPKINVHALFQSLCNVGLLTPQRGNHSNTENTDLEVHIVDFKEPASLKRKQSGIIEILYSGLQCSSCGVRFSTKHTEVFRKHLDWHFYQNHTLRCLKECNRKWYCNKKLWIQSEEDGDKSETETTSKREVCLKEEFSVPSHKHPQGIKCELCGDKFEEFFNEDQDEWHLRDCMSFKGLVYHPICYKDYQMLKPGAAPLETEKDKNASKIFLETSHSENEVNEQHSNLDGTEMFVIDVPNNDVQITKDSWKVTEKCQFFSKVSLDMTLEQKVPQGLENPISHKCDTENILCEETETLVKESKKSACSVTDPSSDTKDLIEMEDLQTASTQCSYSCVEAAAAASVSPCTTKGDMSNKPLVFCDESIKELDATISNGTIKNLLWPLEPSSEELEPQVLKPKLVGRKLQQLPPAIRGSETSNLCSLS